MDAVPRLRSVVLDAPDARALAEFYRQLLRYEYRPGDEPPPEGEPDVRGRDYVLLRDPTGRGGALAFQQEPEQRPSTWPSHEVPMQLHLDTSVPTVEDLLEARARAESLGARLVLDRVDAPDQPLVVLADPAGHPFCIFAKPDDVP